MLLTSQRINSPDRWVILLETDHYLEPGGGEDLSKWRTWPFSLWSTFYSCFLPILSLPRILLTIFTKATRLPSSRALRNSLLALTHKFSHISISEMPDFIKFQFICFRNCCCAALFECHANNPKATRQRCISFRGEDPERTSKMSNNEEFYVKVKFIPRT